MILNTPIPRRVVFLLDQKKSESPLPLYVYLMSIQGCTELLYKVSKYLNAFNKNVGYQHYAGGPNGVQRFLFFSYYYVVRIVAVVDVARSDIY